MKKIKRLIALIVIIIGESIYASNEFLDINLIGYFNPDTQEPL